MSGKPLPEFERAWMAAAEEFADEVEAEEPDTARTQVLFETLAHDFGDVRRQLVEHSGSEHERRQLEARLEAGLAIATTGDLREIERKWRNEGFLRAAAGIGYMREMVRADAESDAWLS